MFNLQLCDKRLKNITNRFKCTISPASRYLVKNATLFSASDYEVAPPEYHRKAVWEPPGASDSHRPSFSSPHHTITGRASFNAELQMRFFSPKVRRHVPLKSRALITAGTLLSLWDKRKKHNCFFLNKQLSDVFWRISSVFVTVACLYLLVVLLKNEAQFEAGFLWLPLSRPCFFVLVFCAFVMICKKNKINK